MIDGITLFDCTVREAGYQTGWFFDETFLCDYYRFAEAAGFDYMELGFFHNPDADPNRGLTRYCMTDAILNSKISLAKAKGIEVVADAHIPVKLKSSEIDLCCIIGNLFDNAIEASMKLPPDQRVIRVYMDMKNTQLYISFTNFTAGKKMKKEGKLFRSTKGDGHGFGLVRIDAIVERLEGYISRNSEDGAFTTEILLPQV